MISSAGGIVGVAFASLVAGMFITASISGLSNKFRGDLIAIYMTQEGRVPHIRHAKFSIPNTIAIVIGFFVGIGVVYCFDYKEAIFGIAISCYILFAFIALPLAVIDFNYRHLCKE